MLHSKIIGNGVPIVILHGFLGMGDNWKTLGKQFADHGYQVHLVDQRNHGRSFHSDDFSYDFMARDLNDYCEAHTLENIVLLGHSMGGKTAMAFATTYPDSVSKLIVADIAPRYYPQHHQTILEGLQALAQDQQALSGRKEAEDFLATYVPDMGTRLFLLKNLYWVVPGKKLGLRMHLPALIRHIDQIGMALPEGVRFDKDTLFLRGEKSDYIKDEDIDEIHRAFAKAHIVTIADAGHWLHAENPQLFMKEVLNFL